MTEVTIPLVAAGHWSTSEGHSIAVEYALKDRRDLMMGELSDLDLANQQYLVGRYDLELIHFQTASKERIRWLSTQLAVACAALEAVSAVRPVNWADEDDEECAEAVREHADAWRMVDAALAKVWAAAPHPEAPAVNCSGHLPSGTGCGNCPRCRAWEDACEGEDRA